MTLGSTPGYLKLGHKGLLYIHYNVHCMQLVNSCEHIDESSSLFALIWLLLQLCLPLFLIFYHTNILLSVIHTSKSKYDTAYMFVYKIGVS